MFEASKQALKRKLNTQFIALEINPILVCILHIRRLFEPNKKNIQIIWGDMFKINFKQFSTFDFSLTTIYLYISPWLIEKQSHI
jgi:16S rRNA A1518/A1519 N6-dimethyltransferase RsmA/KsgA/DIM1 with predicted DNA glycosylase/AP lyase activity